MKKIINKSHLRLSAGGRIAAFVGLAFCTAPSFAAGIESANQATTVSQKNSVDVVNIATPNANGLSHNQYKEFNVGKQGAVLNNSLLAGQSQLAGQLAKNPHLSNQAARVILNEVIEKNPSLLAGQQEIFGMAADYVLANPNGITCDGCGFINTPRASLVVGTPAIEDGKLSKFMVGQGQSAQSLVARGNISGAEILDLIAPRVDLNGNIAARKDINVIAGRQLVNYEDLSIGELPIMEPVTKDVISNQNKEKVEPVVLDGTIFGSMQANRIRIHNSDPSAKTKINAQINAQENLSAKVEGQLNVVGSQLDAQNISLQANNLNLDSELKSDEKSYFDEKSTEFLRQETKSGKHQQETLNKTIIRGDKVGFWAKDNVALNAADIQAIDLDIKGNGVQLNNIKTNQAKTDSVKDSKLSWFNETIDSKSEQAVHGSSLNVKNNLSIHATNQVLANAANIQAGSVNIQGEEGVLIDGSLAHSKTSTLNHYQNETAQLKTGEHLVESESQEFTASRINGTNVSLKSQRGDVRLTGANVNSQNALTIEAGNQSIIDTANSTAQEKDVEHFTYWGGIGGGNTVGEESSKNQQHISNLSGSHVSITGQKGIKITAADVQSDNDVVLTNQTGDIVIDHAFNQQNSLANNRHGSAFNITDKSHKESSEQSELIGANIQGNNVLISGDTTRLTSGKINANKDLIINTNKTLTDASGSQTVESSEDYNLGFKTNGEKEGSITDLKLKGGLRLEGVTITKQNQKGSAVANVLNGQNVQFNSKNGEIHLKGSKIKGQNLALTADKVINDAALVQTSGSSKITEVSGGGVYVAGSLEKVSVGFQAGTDQTHHHESEKTAIHSQFDIENDVVIEGREIQNIGTEINAGNNINIIGDTVENQEAHHIKTDKTVNGRGGVDISIFAKPAPQVGGTATISGSGDGEEITEKTALVSQINGNAIKVNGARKITDQGTQYQSANNVELNSKNYQAKAAQNTWTSVGDVAQAKIGISASTGDFQSVTLKGGADTSYKHISKGRSQAVLGNIQAQDDVIIQGEKLNIASNINAGNRIELTGKEVTVNQANDREWLEQGGFKLGGSVGATYVPAASGVGVTPDFSFNAGADFLKKNDTKAAQATLNAQNIQIKADKKAQIIGTNINAKQELSIDSKESQIEGAHDTHRAQGADFGGNLAFSLSINNEGVGGGSGGLGGDLAIIDETSKTAKASNINAQNVKVFANSEDLPLLVSNVRIQANDIKLQNKKGNVELKAAESKIDKANWGIGYNFGASGSKDGGMSGFDLGGKIDVATDHSQYHQKGVISGQNIDIQSGKNTVLQGDIQAKKLNIQAQEDIQILSAQDQTNAVDFTLGGNVGGSPVEFNGETTVKDVASSLKDDYENGSVMGIKADAELSLNINKSKETQKSQIQAQELNATSGSQQVLINASEVQSQTGKGFGVANVTQTENTDYTQDSGFSISAATPNLKEMFDNLINGKKVENPIKASSHHHEVKPHQVSSNVNIK